MSVELWISSSPIFKSPLSSCVPHVIVWVYPGWTAGGFSYSMDRVLSDAWLHFLGLKVGNIYLYSSFLIMWWR
jgi:hypothetical protein